MEQLKSIRLKEGRDKSARQYHPWLFSGAISSKDAGLEAGEIVRVLDATGEFVAYGYFNPTPQIQVRLLEWDSTRPIDDEWWFNRINEAVQRRAAIAADRTSNAYRLVYGESDFLPGLIVDKYSNFVVLQALTAGVERAKAVIVDALGEIVHPSGIYERSDVDVRQHEGLPQHKGLAYGDEPDDEIVIRENDLQFSVDIKNGQKTGFYLDQRVNRAITASYAAGLDILDCFSFSGAFAAYCLKAGASSSMLVDSSEAALARVKKQISLNRLDSDRVEYIKGDAFAVLRQFHDADRQFDMVILDPPKFAPTKAQVQKALPAYKDINLAAMRLIKREGLLITFSCSGGVDPETFKLVVFWASVDAGRQVQILHTLTHPVDHPRLASFPESEYLTGLICRVC